MNQRYTFLKTKKPMQPNFIYFLNVDQSQQTFYVTGQLVNSLGFCWTHTVSVRHSVYCFTTLKNVKPFFAYKPHKKHC